MMCKKKFLPAICLGLIKVGKQKTDVITGAIGFIDFHISKRLIEHSVGVNRLKKSTANASR